MNKKFQGQNFTLKQTLYCKNIDVGIIKVLDKEKFKSIFEFNVNYAVAHLSSSKIQCKHFQNHKSIFVTSPNI